MSEGVFSTLGIQLVFLSPTAENKAQIAEDARKSRDQIQEQMGAVRTGGGGGPGVPTGGPASYAQAPTSGGSYNAVAGPAWMQSAFDPTKYNPNGIRFGAGYQNVGQAQQAYQQSQQDLASMKRFNPHIYAEAQNVAVATGQINYEEWRNRTSPAGMHQAREEFGDMRTAQREQAAQARREQAAQARLENYREGRDTAYENRLANDARRAETNRVRGELDVDRDVTRTRNMWDRAGEREARSVRTQELQVDRDITRTRNMWDRAGAQVAREERGVDANVTRTRTMWERAGTAEQARQASEDRMHARAGQEAQRYFANVQADMNRGQDRQHRDETWMIRDQNREQRQQDTEQRRIDRQRVAAENRQYRDESSMDREEFQQARRSQRANLSRRLGEAWTHAGRARILEAEAAQFGEGTPEHDQYMGRASRERSQGFFGRPSGRVIAMQAMFGLWEASRAMRGAQQIMNPTGLTSEQKMSSQMQGINSIGGGIYGSIALEGLELAKYAGFNVPTASGVQAAQDQARLGQLRVASGVENKINLTERLNRQAQQTDRQSQVENARNPWLQRRGKIAADALTQLEAYDDDINEKVKKYNSLGEDQAGPEGIQLRDQIVTAKERRGRIRGAVEGRAKAAIKHDIETQDRENQVEGLRQTGFSYQAAVQQINNEYDAYMGANGEMQFDGLTSSDGKQYTVMLTSYNQAMNAAKAKDNQAGILSATRHSSAYQMMQHDPLKAQQIQLWGEMKAATAGLDPTSPEYKRAQQSYNDQMALAQQQWDERHKVNMMGLEGEGRALGELLKSNPNEVGARSIRASTSAQVAMQQIADDRGGTKEGKQEIQKLASNSIMEQQLIKRDYLDGIRAQEFDPYANVSNPRDTEDFGAAMKSVNEEIKGIRAKMDELI